MGEEERRREKGGKGEIRGTNGGNGEGKGVKLKRRIKTLEK